MTELRILHGEKHPKGDLIAAIFDFDGTFSTLRHGWEQVMRPLMLECISGDPAEAASDALKAEVDAYIDTSTGIQTVYQMRWLRDRVEAEGRGVPGRDEWWYKAEYNRRLMEQVSGRLRALESGEAKPEDFLIRGAVEFLHALRERGAEVYLASGTDHCDVVREAAALGVADAFTQVRGAPEHMAACSKEAVIRQLMEERGIAGERMLIVGDGKVEIALGAQAGALTLGAATDEGARSGWNGAKYDRLVNAGADAMTGDFEDTGALLRWLGYIV